MYLSSQHQSCFSNCYCQLLPLGTSYTYWNFAKRSTEPFQLICCSTTEDLKAVLTTYTHTD
ncbi:hypothetical protein Hanom_Chr15g01365321 [Helianthus anomalus]